jgi:pimeloyl-ACP methyl ester carboxylesterase
MSVEPWPWVFCSGTGVLGRLGPVRLPFAAIGYRLVQEIVEDSELHCMPNAGTGPLEGTYEFIEERLLRRAGSGKVNLAGHSQPATHFLRFAALHPEKVGKVLSVAGAHFGSKLATKFPLSLVPCSKDLAPESDYLLKVQEEYRQMREAIPRRDQPRITCLAFPGDTWVVDPWTSSLVPGADNLVLSHKQPEELPYGAVWEPTSKEHGHFDVIVASETIAIMARAAHSAPRRSSKRSARKVVASGGLIESGRRAA